MVANEVYAVFFATRRKTMSTVNLNRTVLVSATESPFEEAHMAAAAFLARYSGRTLETYRFDLRSYFEWCDSVGLVVLEAKRPHIELWRAASEERGLAASTIDRRLSTICGYYRFAHIDGRISANPAQYVRRPKVHPSEGRGLDRGELGTFLFTAERYDRDHAALAVLLGLNGLRVSEACATEAQDLGFDRAIGRCASSARATSPPSFRSSHGWPAPSTWSSASAARARSSIGATASASTDVPPTAGCGPSARGLGSGSSIPTCSGPPSSWPPSTPECRCVTSSWPPATPTRGPRRSMTVGGRTSTVTPPTSSWRSSPAVRVPWLSS